MADFLLTPAALRDVEDIWRYTVEQWGTAQAIQFGAKHLPRALPPTLRPQAPSFSSAIKAAQTRSWASGLSCPAMDWKRDSWAANSLAGRT